MAGNDLGTPENREGFLNKLSFELDPDLRCQNLVIVDALAFWHRARGTRELPARSDFVPESLPPSLLPHLLLMDVEHRPRLRFRWRLVGTYICQRLGRDSTGRYFDELYDPEVRAAVCAGPLWTLEHRRPVRTIGRAPVADRGHMVSENIDMPFSTDGWEIDLIISASTYE